MVTRTNLVRYICILFSWLFMMAGLYTAIDNWYYATSFYAAVDSGFSIGYGSVAETYQLSKFVTIIHVCVGAALVASVASLLIEALIDILPSASTAARQKILRDEEVASAKKEGCQKMFYKVVEFYGDHDQFVKTFFVFIVWLAIGMGVMSTFEPTWTFIDLLYFGITGMSTGGLQGPTPDPANCISYRLISDDPPEPTCMLKTGEAVFVAFFSIIGVPLYGALVGFGSSILIKAKLKKRVLEQILAAPDLETRAMVKMFVDQDDGLTWSEFLILKLVQIDQVDVDTCVQLRRIFDLLDKNKDGTLSKTEIAEVTPKTLLKLLKEDEERAEDNEDIKEAVA